MWLSNGRKLSQQSKGIFLSQDSAQAISRSFRLFRIAAFLPLLSRSSETCQKKEERINFEKNYIVTLRSASLSKTNQHSYPLRHESHFPRYKEHTTAPRSRKLLIHNDSFCLLTHSIFYHHRHLYLYTRFQGFLLNILLSTLRLAYMTFDGVDIVSIHSDYRYKRKLVFLIPLIVTFIH